MYSILFDWNWNNPGYAAGKLMTKALVKEYGKDCLKKYLTSNPMNFILDYISLAKAKPALYPYHFSSKFETIVQAILKK